MRKLLIAAIGVAAAMVPATASAQWGRGGGYYNHNRGEVAREVRECRRELRRADSRREYRRELRECRREINRAQRGNGYYGNRGYYDQRGYRYDRRYHGRRW